MVKIYSELHDGGTELSRLGNHILGDRTGRTITKTTMEGVENITNGKFMPSGEVTHAAMIAGGAAIFSKNKAARTFGLITWGIIGLAYLAGR